MPQVMLDRARVVPVVGQLVSIRYHQPMAETVNDPRPTVERP
jgi:hypothetical protein